eukprot:4657883-Prymnesium_polylepis.1
MWQRARDAEARLRETADETDETDDGPAKRARLDKRAAENGEAGARGCKAAVELGRRIGP